MEAVKKLKEEGLNPEFHQLDITSAQSIETFRKYLQDKYGGLDILINNAGIEFKVMFKIHDACPKGMLFTENNIN